MPRNMLALLLLAATPLQAQPGAPRHGQIFDGRIFDATGGVLASATVSVGVVFTHITVAEGLADRRVEAFAQDGASFLTPPWWATWWFRALALALIVGCAAAIFAWSVSGLERRRRALEAEISERRQIEEALRASNREIQNLAGRLITAQEAERTRIARELHDDLGQEVALLNVEIDQIAAQLPSGTHRSRLQNVSRRVSEIARTVHNLSHDLHPSKLQMLGLVAAVQSLCRDASQRVGIAIDFTHDGTVPHTIDSDVSLCMYRVLQEALNNIAKHSHARDASVRLTCENGDVNLFIADSGVGFDARNLGTEGLGLVSMRERVNLLKGQLVIHAAPGAGTRIGVKLPLSRQSRGPIASVLKSAYDFESAGTMAECSAQIRGARSIESSARRAVE